MRRNMPNRKKLGKTLKVIIMSGWACIIDLTENRRLALVLNEEHWERAWLSWYGV